MRGKGRGMEKRSPAINGHCRAQGAGEREGDWRGEVAAMTRQHVAISASCPGPTNKFPRQSQSARAAASCQHHRKIQRGKLLLPHKLRVHQPAIHKSPAGPLQSEGKYRAKGNASAWLRGCKEKLAGRNLPAIDKENAHISVMMVDKVNTLCKKVIKSCYRRFTSRISDRSWS